MNNILKVLVSTLIAIMLLHLTPFLEIVSAIDSSLPKTLIFASQPFKARMWFDLAIENPGQSLELELDEFPDTVFRWTRFQFLTSTDADGEKVLSYGWNNIQSIYLADLNGDGFPEFCSTTLWGSGYIDERICVYDYATKKTYQLSDRTNYNFSLFIKNEGLFAMQKAAIRPFSVVKIGNLAIIDNELVIINSEQQKHKGTAHSLDPFRPATITLSSSDSIQISSTTTFTATTTSDGTYTLDAPAGTGYTLAVSKPGYLSYTIENFILKEGEDLPTIDLKSLAGDINGDGVINAEDLTYMLSEFNKKPVNWKYADITDSGIINAVDLTYLLAGFNKRNVVVQWIEE